jgi:hypothetical protein
MNQVLLGYKIDWRGIAAYCLRIKECVVEIPKAGPSHAQYISVSWMVVC